MKVKDIFSKLIISILIVLILSNSILSTYVYADEIGEMLDSVDDMINGFVSATLGTIVGLFISPFATVAEVLALAADGLIAGIAYSQGSIDENGNIDVHDRPLSITPFDIFFNKVALLDVNFFNIPNDDSMISNIRTSIASWYYVMRNLAAAILLCVLIYVGIRMAITTIASDKASYKKMLVDWICSLALIFLIQYIIIFTLEVNSAFIRALSGVSEGEELQKAIIEIKKNSADWSLNGIAATVVYCMLIGQTLGLVITYFNRMLKIAFLIIISPLITLTYSIDKMGDGKAQALGTWLKEFVFSVLIQTFHCVIYMAFISMAATLLNDPVGLADNNNLAGAIISMLCIKFTKDAEKILGKIFKFSDSTSDTSLAVGMAASAMALSKAKSFGKGTRKAINGIGNIKNNVSHFARTARVEALAINSMRKQEVNPETGEKMTYEEAKEAAEAKVANKVAAKMEKKNNKNKYAAKSGTSEYDKRVEDVAAELRATGKYTEAAAKAKARERVAKETRANAKKAKSAEFNKKHKFISGVRGTASSIRSTYRLYKNSETGAVIRDISRSIRAGGAGMFIGASNYGATGNEFNSIALGIAAGKSTKEFFATSTGNLKFDANEILTALNIGNEVEAEREMNDVLDMAGIYGDGENFREFVNDLMSQIDQIMGPGREANNVKSTMRNVITKEIKKNPGITKDQLQSKLMKQQVVKEAVDGDSRLKSVFPGMVENLSKAYHRKELYDTMQSASDMGVDAKTFIKSVSKGASKYGYLSNAQLIHNVTTGNQPKDKEKPQALTEREVMQQRDARDEAEFEALRSEFEAKLEEAQADYSSAPVRSEERADAHDEALELAKTLQKMNDTDLEVMARKYEQQFEELKRKLTAEIKALGESAVSAEIDSVKASHKDNMRKIEKDFIAERDRMLSGATEKINVVSGEELSHYSDGIGGKVGDIRRRITSIKDTNDSLFGKET